MPSIQHREILKEDNLPSKRSPTACMVSQEPVPAKYHAKK